MSRYGGAVRMLPIALVLSLLPVVVSAWSYSGHRWPTSEIRYYVNPANADGISAEDALAAIRAGLNAWQIETGANLSFLYMGATAVVRPTVNGRNEVMFSPDLLDGNLNIGQTIRRWESTTNGPMTEADIVLYDARYRFFRPKLRQIGCKF